MALAYKWFRLPFAAAGTKAAIPDATQGDGTMSYNEGFGPDYQLDPATDPAAIDIPRDKTNQLYNDITTALQWYQSGHAPQWIAASDNGGVAYSYDIGAHVLYTDGFIYESFVAANTTTPGLGSNSWSRCRVRLAAATTFYVATTGSDFNDGLTTGTPWLTIQHAVDVLQFQYDAAGYPVTIQVADGTYANGAIISQFVGQAKTGSALIIQGNPATPANCIIASTLIGFSARQGSLVNVNGFKISTSDTSSGVSLAAISGGTLTFQNVEFAASGNSHIAAQQAGAVTAVGPYKISGGGNVHVASIQGGVVLLDGVTVTITGTPAFAKAFAQADHCGNLFARGTTFTGSATGQRYLSTLNANIETGAGGANYFPGSTAGVSSLGGNYI